MNLNSGIELQKDPLFDFLYKWVNQIINQENRLNIEIVESHTGEPQAKQDEVFIVIKYAPVINKVGHEARTPTDENGKRSSINDYENTMEVWEVNGIGKTLKMLINSIGRQDIRDLWKKNGYSYLGENNIGPVPNTQENRWKRQSLVEFIIGSAEAVQEDVGVIEDVGTKGTIPAQGRDGEHTIQ